MFYNYEYVLVLSVICCGCVQHVASVETENINTYVENIKNELTELKTDTDDKLNELLEQIDLKIDEKLTALYNRINKIEKSIALNVNKAEEELTQQTPNDNKEATSLDHVNGTLDDVDNVLENDTPLTLKTVVELENRINRDVKMAANEMISQLTANITKQVTDKLVLIVQEKDICNTLQKTNVLKTYFKDLFNLTANLSNTLTNMYDNDSKPVIVTYKSGCDITVPNSIKIKEDIWNRYNLPTEDDLDVFMSNTTGCKYVGATSKWQTLSAATLQGAHEWRVAVRARRWLNIRIISDKNYWEFHIGHKNQSDVKVYESIRYRTFKLTALDTPAIISKDTYTFFKITLNNDTLTFGKLCDVNPMFTHKLTVPLETLVKFDFMPSIEGGKALYDCPLAASNDTGLQ